MRKTLWVVFILALIVVGCSQAQNEIPVGLEKKTAQGASQTLVERATALLSQGQFPDAVQVLQQAVTQFPNDPAAYFLLADIYMRAGAFDNAIVICQQLIERNLNVGQAYFLMAGCFDLKGESEKAIELVKVSIEIFEKQGETVNLEAARSVLQKMTATP